jgi:hypothetical protein
MSEKDFDKLQKGYYQNEINRGLPAQKQFDANTISAALGISTAFQPTISPSSVATTFGVDSPAYSRDATCRAMRTPTLGMHNADARVGCGWWYASDQNAQSVGAYGTRRGPMNTNLDRTVGRGRWIWDAREAMKAEALKQSQTILSCDDLQYTKYPNMGWCTDGNGQGVVSNGKRPMYSEQVCSSPVITDYRKCPVPEVPVADITNTCTPVNGSLTPACLQMLARQKCSKDGALSVALQNGYAGTNPTFTAMNKVLRDYQFTIPSGIVSDGRISMDTATSAFQQISQFATSPIQDGKQNAAAGLCTNAALFNECKGFGPNDIGSKTPRPPSGYPPTCVSKAANALGWTSGSYMPSNGGMTYWNTIGTWGAVLAEMKRLYTSATTGSSTQEQIASIKKVFGVDVVPPQNNCESRILDYLGCYRDTWSRAIPNQRNNVYNNPVKECADQAKLYGDNVFGLQDGAQCFTGKDPQYNRYGQVPNNECGPVGNPWTQQTYKLGTIVSKPTFYVQTDFRGTGVGLDRGRYPFSRFTQFIGNDTLSSIRVPTGYSVTIYQDDIGSRSTTMTSDIANLSTIGFDKTISAIVIS